MAYNFTAVEKKWQRYWLENQTFRALDPADAGGMPKAYVLDMFPYPSGAGLHVGHPEGYTATDIVSRFLRMRGCNVLHPMGWDAFGLPAEQHAVATGVHPRINTAQNVDNFRRQIRMLGLSYDWEREVDTTDPGYYRWTQWIFLQLFNSYFDPVGQKARPVEHLLNELVNENLVVAPDNSIHVNPSQEGMEAIAGEVRVERLWRELPPDEQREVIDAQRLAYMDEAPVNWCPALGTVLSNEEVIDGRSERGNFPVERRPMRQWMLRITAYADRLLADLETLAWPESLKEMQRNWIGKSVGAEIEFDIVPPDEHVARTERAADVAEDREAGLSVTVFTTRPDTLYGATYMVLAPEHPLVDRITPAARRETVEAYRTMVAGRSDRDRMADAKEKTGVATGAFAVNPINDERIPIYIADYVMMGYGTGAIMAVPAHDERDFAFARQRALPMRLVVAPDLFAHKPQTLLLSVIDRALNDPRSYAVVSLERGDGTLARAHVLEACSTLGFPGESFAIEEIDHGRFAFTARHPLRREQLEGLAEALPDAYQVDHVVSQAYVVPGVSVNSELINGLTTREAKRHVLDVLEREGTGRRTVKYKLRDWLFSRQRYWGEPFPILLDEHGNPHALDESELPLTLPEIADFKPTGSPEGPLSKATDWLRVERDDKVFTRETNTMPQWAGSCWYYLRYIDPRNEHRFVDPEKERYWMPVDLYVGGVEHAVLHLLYARFWHKVLFDLGHVSTAEPFARLVNQGLILGEMEFNVFETAGGKRVNGTAVSDIHEEATPSGAQLVGTYGATGEKVFGRPVPERFLHKSSIDGNYYYVDHEKEEEPNARVDARSFKMSKSRGNVVNPDAIVADYGADTFRLYEMYMGPLEAQKPWNTRDIVGMSRFLNGVWRNLVGHEEDGTEARKRAESATARERHEGTKVGGGPIPEAVDRQMHRAIKKVAEDVQGLRFNTAIAELIKLNNAITGLPAVPRELAENLTLMLAPFAPHLAEELWERLGHTKSLARRPWPTYDEAKLVEAEIELPVQVNGKVRDKIRVPADADEATVLQAAEASERLKPWIEGKTVKKRLYVPKRLVNLVVG